ncbi:MAG: hypothetical protein EBY84_08120 [Acidimicrobiia bacterium]|nr:hypothetical protein [Acidimicrobiia bacterium]
MPRPGFRDQATQEQCRTGSNRGSRGSKGVRRRPCIGAVVRYLLTESQRVSKDNGGVPPFGHTTQLRVFVDSDLLQYDEVWAAAGTWNDNFGAAPADIVRVAGGVVTDLKRA